jgi:hypothetical protein
MKIKKVCEECGSDNVYVEAYAEWDVDAQAWVLATKFDNCYCSSCDDENYCDTETRIINQEIKETSA